MMTVGKTVALLLWQLLLPFMWICFLEKYDGKLINKYLKPIMRECMKLIPLVHWNDNTVKNVSHIHVTSVSAVCTEMGRDSKRVGRGEHIPSNIFY